MSKPVIWIIFCFVINFSFFYLGSKISNSFNVVWWSSFIGLFSQASTLTKGLNKNEEDKVFEEIGVKFGRYKRNIGLFSYSIGGIMGWIIFYGELYNIKTNTSTPLFNF
jgi:hypothetical protein